MCIYFKTIRIYLTGTLIDICKNLSIKMLIIILIEKYWKQIKYLKIEDGWVKWATIHLWMRILCSH